ncbi:MULTISPECIES: hypothetical protein [Ralstonia solanacearum species complex]|uniref:hypothetical protein n=1 Tax=Ralstonia solanacearum species complex TaxID=3116862 RepID=UPI0010721678|nr:hypothetical protein [Ralstonia solanacearum]
MGETGCFLMISTTPRCGKPLAIEAYKKKAATIIISQQSLFAPIQRRKILRSQTNASKENPCPRQQKS